MNVYIKRPRGFTVLYQYKKNVETNFYRMKNNIRRVSTRTVLESMMKTIMHF